LKIIGYNNGVKASEYILKSQDEISKIAISTNKKTIDASGYDVAVVEVNLVDKNGSIVTDKDSKITFTVTGEGKNIGVDNGWEMNIQPHKTNEVVSHNGKAVIYIQSSKNKGEIKVKASIENEISNEITLSSK